MHIRPTRGAGFISVSKQDARRREEQTR